MVGVVIIARARAEDLQAEQFIMEKSSRINATLSNLFFKTEILAALIQYGGGEISDFDTIAAIIVDDPAILNVLIAPGGVVTRAYPVHEGIDALIGLDFFDEGESGGNREAILAVETGELVMAGPFMARQGHMVLAGRLPVFNDAEKTDLWGLVSVTLRFPEALDNADLESLRMRGFEYELWRICPDTGERQVLDSNLTGVRAGTRYRMEHITFLNADWYLRIMATRSWYHYPEVIGLILAGLFISFLMLFVVQNNHRLKQTRSELAILAKTDSLTGIYNRRHFAELVQIDIARAQRFNEQAFVIIVDADYFKKINDTCGHMAGDKVLTEFARRMKEVIRPYDLLARYGGEEFIIYMPNSNPEGATAAAERLRRNICDTPFNVIKEGLKMTASFGVAAIEENDFEKAIINADDALYKAKEAGRNRVILHPTANACVPSP
jgi:diguanylate cyclase (GGDEF)-like protein